MLQIGCIWCVVVHKNPRSCRALSFVPNDRKNTRWSRRGLLKNWILFWVVHCERKNQYNVLILGRIKTCSKTPPDMKEHPRVIGSRLVDLKEARKNHEVGPWWKMLNRQFQLPSSERCSRVPVPGMHTTWYIHTHPWVHVSSNISVFVWHEGEHATTLWICFGFLWITTH